jgi:hypothetical protein
MGWLLELSKSFTLRSPFQHSRYIYIFMIIANYKWQTVCPTAGLTRVHNQWDLKGPMITVTITSFLITISASFLRSLDLINSMEVVEGVMNNHIILSGQYTKSNFNRLDYNWRWNEVITEVGQFPNRVVNTTAINQTVAVVRSNQKVKVHIINQGKTTIDVFQLRLNLT